MSDGRQMRRLSIVIALGWVILDQLTKHWAVNRLSDDRIVHVAGSLQFNLSFNSGMAFGKGKGFGPVLGVVALVVVVAVLLGLRTEGRRLSAIAVGLVVGGAVGNLCDRLFRSSGWFRGAVVDFIDLQWWPVFNVADIGITVGATLLVFDSLRSGRRRKINDATSA